MKAGAMMWSLAFEEPEGVDDGYGGSTTGWHERHRCAADIIFLRGGEAVQAARLTGAQPVVIRVRSCPSARAITTDCRARDCRDGTIYNLRGTKPTPDRQFLEFTAESGVAT